MRIGWTLAALTAAAAVLAAAAPEPASFPDGYWERGWGFSPSGTSYAIALKVADPERSAGQAQKLLVDGGARLIGAPPPDGARPRGPGRVALSLQYEAKAASAQKLAKKLLDLGELQSYNVNRFGGGLPLQEIDERLKLIEREQEANAAALKSMPVASYLLEAQKRRLLQAREAAAESAERATIILTLLPAGPAGEGDGAPPP